MNKPKAECEYFRPGPTNKDVCAKWIWPVGGNGPFCLAGEACKTNGLRLEPRADQEEDSFE